jgi:hypothetical protein
MSKVLPEVLEANAKYSANLAKRQSWLWRRRDALRF